MFKKIRKSIVLAVLVTFLGTSIQPSAFAQIASVNLGSGAQLPWMPKPGVRMSLSPEFTPALLKGITIHPENALMFDFIIYRGDTELSLQEKQDAYKKLIKYFLASLAVPDEDQWVNLSPYENNRIIKDDFGKTEMGRDLLAQDYILKQITASLIYPEESLGKKFWDKIYSRAQEQFGTTNVPINTFNKVWIVPDDALIYEKGNTAYVIKNHLKVMLEEDYLSLQKHTGIANSLPPVGMGATQVSRLGSQITREIILPALEQEVNEGKNFAPLRQVYSGMILAAWFKRTLKESLLGRIYADKSKVKGIDQDPKNNEEIYRRYLKAYKKGVFNYIKEDADKYTNEIIPRKYFSGGTIGMYGANNGTGIKITTDPAMGVPVEAQDADKDDAVLAALNTRQDVGKAVPADGAMSTIDSSNFGVYFEELINSETFKKNEYAKDLSKTNSSKRSIDIALFLTQTYSVISDEKSLANLQDRLNRLIAIISEYKGSTKGDQKNSYYRDLMDKISYFCVHFSINIYDKGQLLLNPILLQSINDARVKPFLPEENRLFKKEPELLSINNKYQNVENNLSKWKVKREGTEFTVEIPVLQIPEQGIGRENEPIRVWIEKKIQLAVDNFHVTSFKIIKGDEGYIVKFNVTEYSVADKQNRAKRLRDLIQLMERKLQEEKMDREEAVREHKSSELIKQIDQSIATFTELRGNHQEELDSLEGDYAMMIKVSGEDVLDEIRAQALSLGLNTELLPDTDMLGSITMRFSLSNPPVNDTVRETSALRNAAAQVMKTLHEKYGYTHRATFGSNTNFLKDVEIALTPKMQLNSKSVSVDKKMPASRNFQRIITDSRGNPLYSQSGVLELSVPTFKINPAPQTTLGRWLEVAGIGLLGASLGAAAALSNRVKVSIAPQQLNIAQPASSQTRNGGIDLNSAHLNLQIKRDGHGIPLPLAQQDMTQLNLIEGLEPVILAIKPASQTPLFSNLQTTP